MPTRPRGTTGRSSKTKASAPPFAGDALKDESNTSASESSAEAERTQSTEITGGSLERRELPSFSDDRAQRIAERAYWRAERRGFAPGRELDDWLEAEREVDSDEVRPEDGRTA